MIRALAAGFGIGLSIFGVAFAAFYYGIWPVSAVLDQDPNHPV